MLHCRITHGLQIWNILFFPLKIKDHKNQIISILCTDHPNSSVTSFADELSDKLERDITKPGQITLLGDFNIKMNKPKDADTIILSDFLESFNLEKRVNYTTNHTESTIDLVITQENSSHVSNIVKNTLFSDHHLFSIFHQQKQCPYTKLSPTGR